MAEAGPEGAGTTEAEEVQTMRRRQRQRQGWDKKKNVRSSDNLITRPVAGYPCPYFFSPNQHMVFQVTETIAYVRGDNGDLAEVLPHPTSKAH
jgi:hypothetical protein